MLKGERKGRERSLTDKQVREAREALVGGESLESIHARIEPGIKRAGRKCSVSTLRRAILGEGVYKAVLFE
jgi:hypothetical protein